MEKLWEESKIYESDADDEQAAEDMIYYSDVDDEFESEDKNENSGNDNLDHSQWAFGMLDYFMKKWKQKKIGIPPSNWKDILIKLLDLEHFQSVDPNEDFERFMTEDFTEDYNEQQVLSSFSQSGWFPDVKPIGLKGGFGHTKLQQASHLKLSNNKSEATKNICFTNSVLQLLRNTSYVSILLNQFPHFLVGKSPSQYKLCRALLSIYSEKTRERSAAPIRKLVAQLTGKMFLADGTQQDSDEFLRSLISVMCEELQTWDIFRNVNKEHMGKETIIKKFLGNNSTGVCTSCGNYPSSREEDFLCLKLNIPFSQSSLNLSTLITNYFSESSEVIRMKCSECCPHERSKILCPQTGFCNRPAVSQNQLILAPKYLFCHLLRFGNGPDGPKVTTYIKFGTEVRLPNGDVYEVVGVLDHWGSTLKAGHYVTHLKTESGQWFLYNDTQVQHSSLNDANSKENYILLLKRKTVSSEFSTHNVEIETVEEPKESYIREVEESAQNKQEKNNPAELENSSLSRDTKNNRKGAEQPPCEGVLPKFNIKSQKQNVLSGEELNKLIEALESKKSSKRTPEEKKKVR